MPVGPLTQFAAGDTLVQIDLLPKSAETDAEARVAEGAGADGRDLSLAEEAGA